MKLLNRLATAGLAGCMFVMGTMPDVIAQSTVAGADPTKPAAEFPTEKNVFYAGVNNSVMTHTGKPITEQILTVMTKGVVAREAEFVKKA